MSQRSNFSYSQSSEMKPTYMKEYSSNLKAKHNNLLPSASSVVAIVVKIAEASPAEAKSLKNHHFLLAATFFGSEWFHFTHCKELWIILQWMLSNFFYLQSIATFSGKYFAANIIGLLQLGHQTSKQWQAQRTKGKPNSCKASALAAGFSYKSNSFYVIVWWGTTIEKFKLK